MELHDQDERNLNRYYKINAYVAAAYVALIIGNVIADLLDGSEMEFITNIWFYSFIGFLSIGWIILWSFFVVNIMKARLKSDKQPVYIVLSIIIFTHNGYFSYAAIDWMLRGAPMP